MSQATAPHTAVNNVLPLGETPERLRSYLMSSFELRSGLDVRVLPTRQVPADVLRELLRLRAQWPQVSASPPPDSGV